MEDCGGRRNLAPSAKSISRVTVSCFSVFLTQLALAVVPRFFSTSSLVAQLSLSAAALLVVIGLVGWCRRLIGVAASAPAFVVLSVVYTWSVYTFVIKQAVSHLTDVLFNGEVFLLMIGLCRMFTRDPGVVSDAAPSASGLAECRTESYALVGRVRFCRICKAYIKGFDHHCPAFGNCIGQSNHRLFMALLVGFITTEASFAACSYKFLSKSEEVHEIALDSALDADMANGAMLFSLVQLMWQAIFFAWHGYCVCFNIKTEEWVNWKKYPEFQVLIEAEHGEPPRMLFRNPYDKGILRNVKEFFAQKG